MAKGKSHSRHNELKRLLVDTLAFSKCFTDIRAEISGYETPEAIICDDNRGIVFTPDVTAQSEHFNIFEIETPYSLNSKKTGDKWCALAEHVWQNKGKFWVVVPASMRQKAIEKMRILGVDGGVLGL